jgi:hypothetical protein
MGDHDHFSDNRILSMKTITALMDNCVQRMIMNGYKMSWMACTKFMKVLKTQLFMNEIVHTFDHEKFKNFVIFNYINLYDL